MTSLHHEITAAMFKSCPFCGNVPNVFTVPHEGESWWVVECKQMGCMFRRSSPHRSVDDLADDWNKREEPTA